MNPNDPFSQPEQLPPQSQPAVPPSTPQQPYAPQPLPNNPWTQPIPPSSEQPIQQLTPDGLPSIDYLNQIATPQKRGLSFGRKQLLIIGGVILLAFAILVILLITKNARPSLTVRGQQLVAHTSEMIEVTKESQKHIKNTRLANINSSLTLQLTSAEKSITTALSVPSKSIDKKVIAAVSNDKLLATLKDAQLEGTFDRVYGREVPNELTKIIVLAKSMSGATTGNDAKTALDDLVRNIEPLRDQIAAFSRASD